MSRFLPNLLRTSAAALQENAARTPQERESHAEMGEAQKQRRRSGGWTLADQAVLSASSFAATLIVGRTLGDAGLGTYYVGFPVLIVLVTILGSVVTLPYSIRLQSLSSERAATWLGSALVAQGLLLLLLGIALGLGAASIGMIHGLDTGWIALSVVLAGAATWLREFVRRILLAEFRARAAVLVDFTVAVIQIGGMAYLASHHQLTVALSFLITAVAHLVGCAIGVARWRSPIKIDLHQLKSDFREGWKFGRITFVAAMAGTLQAWSIGWLVLAVSTVEVNGRFAEALTIPLLINPIAMGLAAFLTPAYSRRMVESGRDAVRRESKRHALILAGVGLLFLIGIALFGVALLERLYDHTAGPMIWWTLLALTLANVIQRLTLLPMEAVLLTENRPQVILQANLISLVITATSVLLLTPSLGELGPGIAVLTGSLIGECWKVWVYFRTASESTTATEEAARPARSESSHVIGMPFAMSSTSPLGAEPSQLPVVTTVTRGTQTPESLASASANVKTTSQQQRHSVVKPYWQAENDDAEQLAAQENARLRRLNWLFLCIWISILATFSPPGRDETVTAESLDIVAKLKLASRLASTLIITLLVFDRDSWRRNGWLQMVFVPVIAFLAWGAASVTWSAIPSISVGQLMSFSVLCGLAYVAAANVRSMTDVSRLFLHTSGATTMVSLVIMTAHFAVPSIGKLDRGMETGLMHPTSVASSAAVGLLVTLAAAVVWKWKWAMRVVPFVMVLQLVTLIVAANRMSVLMLLPAAGGMIATNVSRRALWAWATVGSMVAFAYLWIDPGFQWIEAALGGTSTYASRGQSSDELGSFSGRYEMWTAQWESFLVSPWRGHGYFVTSRTGEIFVWYNFANWTAHDIWLQVLVTTGVIGFSLFLWALLSWGGRIVSSLRQATDLKPYGPTMGWIVFWYLGWSAINESFMGPFVPESVVFFLLCGIGLSLSAPAEDHEAQAAELEWQTSIEKKRLAFLSPLSARSPKTSPPGTASDHGASR